MYSYIEHRFQTGSELQLTSIVQDTHANVLKLEQPSIMDKWCVTCSYNMIGAFIVVANLCGCAVVVLQIIGVVQS